MRLASERLRITLVDGYTWRARAEYVLANPGPPRPVLFGVPTSWRAHEFNGAPPKPFEEVAEGARQLRITLAGETLTCSPEPRERKGDGRSPRAVRWRAGCARLPAGAVRR